eukprot:scaffold1255_cov120-Isochrysis_galbana.AAC.9
MTRLPAQTAGRTAERSRSPAQCASGGRQHWHASGVGPRRPSARHAAWESARLRPVQSPFPRIALGRSLAPRNWAGCRTTKPNETASASSSTMGSFAMSNLSETTSSRPPCRQERSDDSSERGWRNVRASRPRVSCRAAASAARTPESPSMPHRGAGASEPATQCSGTPASPARGGSWRSGGGWVARMASASAWESHDSAGGRDRFSVAHEAASRVGALIDTTEHVPNRLHSLSALLQPPFRQRTWHAHLSDDSPRPGHGISIAPPFCPLGITRGWVPLDGGPRAMGTCERVVSL